MFRWLPINTSWREVLVRWLPSITCEENISNHGFSGKHARIPDNDYWWICLFHIVWTKFVFAIILMWYTRNIFLFKFSFFTAEYRRNRQIIIIGVPFRAIVPLLIEMKKLAVESNFWKHVLSVKVSSSICSHSLSNKKRWTEDYYIIICLAHGNDRNATLI